jgi:ATP-dependent exoDNAse (exonuclease V) beta subunit
MKRALILSASAGSGKTFRLVLKYICDIIMRPDRYRNILAVTFTNKATEEMKSRIINEIHRLASNSPSQYLEEIIKATQLSEPQIRERALKARTKILHDYSRFTVLTIDRFF